MCGHIRCQMRQQHSAASGANRVESFVSIDLTDEDEDLEHSSDAQSMRAHKTCVSRQLCAAPGAIDLDAEEPTHKKTKLGHEVAVSRGTNPLQTLLHTASKTGPGVMPQNPRPLRPRAAELPCCSPGDHKRASELLATLGVVVFREAASVEELGCGESLFWEWLEATSAGRRVRLQRGRPETHRTQVWRELGYSNTGVMFKAAIGQSAFMWHCRKLLGVLQAWATVWGVPPGELVTSFDGCGSWRNCWLPCADRTYLTQGNWYHLDQNWHERPHFDTLQGLLNFFPANAACGSTVVLPGSHLDFAKNCAGKPSRGSFVRLFGAGVEAYCRDRAVQVLLGPGDVLIWDSRVVHCSSGADITANVRAALPGREKEPLARLVAYIAMMPRERLAPTQAGRERLLEQRRRAVLRGQGSGHDPRRLRAGAGAGAEGQGAHKPPAADDPLWKLV